MLAEIISGASLVLVAIVTAYGNIKDRRMTKIEESRREYMLLLVHMVSANIAATKACVIALKNGRSNGETERAIGVLERMKNDNREFLLKLGIEEMF